MPTKAEVYNALVEFGPNVIREYWNVDIGACIGSTRVGLDVLEHYEIDCKPLPVEYRIFNKVFVEHLLAGDTFDPDRPWPGAHSIGVGLGPAMEAKWPGHLVVQSSASIIDLSIGQASRPTKGITLGPTWFKTPRKMMPGDQGQIKAGDVTILFTVTKNEGYRESPDWTFRHRHKEPVARIIEKMEERLGRSPEVPRT